MPDGNAKHSAASQMTGSPRQASLHSAWLHFIRYCTELGHGEIEKLKIQDGLPMIAELAVKKIKFAP
jgi:hypothetical protein